MKCFNANHKNGSHSVIVIGEGLIGSAIVRSLTLKLGCGQALAKSKYRLSDLQHDITNIERWLAALPPSGRVDWIWSAGKAGFNADEEACNEELRFFTKFCDAIHQLSPSSNNQFHLLSSAGGLFEGTRLVKPDTSLNPIRPYGYLKQAMERVAQIHFDNLHIYRPSSVFGSINDTHRLGMVSTLLKNVRANAVTQVWGSPTTLRDYVWAEDVGRYVCRQALAPMAPGTEIHFLVTAKPTSIAEALSMTQRLTHKPLYVQFNDSNNALDITFCPSVRPTQNWRPHDLETSALYINHRLAII